MIRTTAAALVLGLATFASAEAAVVTKTLEGFVLDVEGAAGLATGDPVTTVVTFDDTNEVFPGTFEISSLTVTLPGDVVLSEADDELGILEVGFDGSTVTSLFVTLTVNEAAFGASAGALEFASFGDGSLAFFLSDGPTIVAEGTVVPIPGALPLMVTAMAGLGWAAARRKNRRDS